jgi:MFS family permease
VISNFALPPISDKFGRKYFTYLGSSVQLIVYTLMSFTTSLTFTYFLMPFFGMTCSIRYCISYSHLMEVYPPSKSSNITSILFFIDGLIAVLAPVIIMMTGSTQGLLYIGIAMHITCLSIGYFKRPGESIRQLITMGKFEEAK